SFLDVYKSATNRVKTFRFPPLACFTPGRSRGGSSSYPRDWLPPHASHSVWSNVVEVAVPQQPKNACHRGNLVMNREKGCEDWPVRSM
ncbi:hypothetical protein SDJN02_10128, partial [Cucurbita argyrosperma subsp. argyrosperma]